MTYDCLLIALLYLLQQPFTCVTGGTTADVGPTGAEAAAEDTDEEAVEAKVVETIRPQVL